MAELAGTDDAGTDIAAVLETQRAELESELERLTSTRSEAGGISFGKRVGEGTSIAVDRLSSVAAHDRLRQKLSSVHRAQQKLVEGTYGSCDVCGEPIPADRLEALPYAVRCVHHASTKR